MIFSFDTGTKFFKPSLRERIPSKVTRNRIIKPQILAFSNSDLHVIIVYLLYIRVNSFIIKILEKLRYSKIN